MWVCLRANVPGGRPDSCVGVPVGGLAGAPVVVVPFLFGVRVGAGVCVGGACVCVCVGA